MEFTEIGTYKQRMTNQKTQRDSKRNKRNIHRGSEETKQNKTKQNKTKQRPSRERTDVKLTSTEIYRSTYKIDHM